ncbi:MAG TPA: CotH kinase family protein [Polyangiaceae bacterium]|nr:CotH kinase family protein [Polyangiaceae bacterium]
MPRARRLALPGLLLTGVFACTSGSAPRGVDEFAGSGGSASDPGVPQPGSGLPGAEVFAAGQYLDVDLTIAAADLQQLEEHGNLEEYVAASVRIERGGQPGLEAARVELAQVGVRHKGNYSLHHCWDDFGGARSYEAECARLSLKLKFDAYDPEARFDGLKRLNLHAVMGDASKLHDLVAYQAFRDFGVDAPRAMPARVRVNGELRGLFIAVEDIDGRYTAAHFPDAPDGNLYKEIWPNASVGDSEFVAALETNEEASDVSGMRAFAEAIARTTPETLADELTPFVDVDTLLRYVAVDRALKNWDGIMAFYAPTTPHNFYWYQAGGSDGRFHLIPWDLDQTLWPFDPYMDPQQWVTAAPIPDFNTRPMHCAPRPIWDEAGTERVTPPRCDRLLDALAQSQWPRLVELGHELLAGPMAIARLEATLDVWAPVLEPLVAEDPLLEPVAWQRAVGELRAVIAQTGPIFERFLGAGLLDEQPIVVPEEPTPADLDALTSDDGLLVGAITNFEFGAPPAASEQGLPTPANVFAYADPLASYAPSWNTLDPISGNADLRFDFTYNRGPGLYDEWSGIGIWCAETDISRFSTLVVWLASDVARTVRVRLSSSAYDELFGGVGSEFGVDYSVGPTPRAIAIDLRDFYYPDWAKQDWTPEQGFPGTDAEALETVLSRFTGLVFGPSATLDPAGELTAPSETGYLRVDNIYLR